jgi:hypothetical protein
MNSIQARLVRPHTKLGRKEGLIAGELAVQPPRAAAPAEDTAALALRPYLVVRLYPAACGGLEDG